MELSSAAEPLMSKRGIRKCIWPAKLTCEVNEQPLNGIISGAIESADLLLHFEFLIAQGLLLRGAQVTCGNQHGLVAT